MTGEGARVPGANRTLLGLREGWRKVVVSADGGLELPWGRLGFAVDGRPFGSDGPVAQKLFHGSLPAVVSQDVHGEVSAGLLAFTGRTPWGPCEFVRVR